MMYGNPTQLGDISWLTVGTANITMKRNIVSMVLAFPAVILYLPFLFGIANLIKENRQKKVYQRLTVIGIMPWLCVHLYVVMVLFNFLWLSQNGYSDIAMISASALAENFMFVFYIGAILMCMPFVYLLYLTVKSKLNFPRIMLLNNPLIIFIILKCLTLLIPVSAFSIGFTNGLMNESMFVWMAIYLIYFTSYSKCSLNS